MTKLWSLWRKLVEDCTNFLKKKDFIGWESYRVTMKLIYITESINPGRNWWTKLPQKWSRNWHWLFINSSIYAQLHVKSNGLQVQLVKEWVMNSLPSFFQILYADLSIKFWGSNKPGVGATFFKKNKMSSMLIREVICWGFSSQVCKSWYPGKHRIGISKIPFPYAIYYICYIGFLTFSITNLTCRFWISLKTLFA